MSPHAQKATWSEYKQHNTIKALVGITPNGYFGFLSKFWSGNTSDRKITQECGIIDTLEEGDAVMAARGFDIHFHRKVIIINWLEGTVTLPNKHTLFYSIFLCFPVL